MEPNVDPRDVGGDPACWSHLFDAPTADLRDRDDIEHLVRDFYRAAAMDDVLGPVFATAHVDWPSHIATLIEFWSWQLLGTHGYEGHPLRAHAPLQLATPFRAEHYRRWLELFETAVDELFVGPMADIAKTRARKMAGALQRLMDGIGPDATDPQDAGDPSVSVFVMPNPKRG